MSLHICMLVYSFYESDNRVMRYAETLARRGDRVDVIALRGDDQPYHQDLRGVRVIRIQHRTKRERSQVAYAYKILKFMARAAFVLSKEHAKDPFDLVHVHNMPDFLVFSAIYAKLTGAKVILDIHDVVPELYATKFARGRKSLLFRLMLLLERASAAFVDHVIVANHVWHQKVTCRSVNKEGKCSVVLNYPDENIFFRRARRKDNGKFVMVYPGSLTRRQGVDIAIRAFALIKNHLPNAEFRIYGDGTGRKYLERLVSELCLNDSVFFKGILPIYDVAEEMSKADLGVEPKRNDAFAGDAMSTKILEFMSLGIPVIASDTRVHKYYFDESVVLFFKSEDEQDLARCMLLLSEDASLRQKMLLKSQQFVQDYVWEKKKEDYLGLVDRLAKGAK